MVYIFKSAKPVYSMFTFIQYVNRLFFNYSGLLRI